MIYTANRLRIPNLGRWKGPLHLHEMAEAFGLLSKRQVQKQNPKSYSPQKQGGSD